jgi:hypothetical protein
MERVVARGGFAGVLIIAAAVLFHAACVALVMAAVPFPSTFDELQHLSFVRWSELHPDLFPRYEAMRVLAPDLRTWKGETILYHPAPYYLLMAALDQATHSIVALRLANAALSIGAVIALLVVGFRDLSTCAERAIYAAVLVTFPKLAVVGAMINNDNLTLCAAALGLLALMRWRDRPDDWLIALALAAAGWTKLTAFLMLGFALGFLALQLGRRQPKAFLWPLAGSALGSLPYLVNLVRYGAPLWHGNALYTPPAQRVALDVGGYLAFFGKGMVRSWAALEPSNMPSLLGAAILLAAGAVLCVIRWGRASVPVALILAAVPALALHAWFGWQAFVRDGFLDAAQVRYYYAVWPGFALGAAILWRAWRGPVRTVLTTTTGALLFAGTAAFCVPAALLVGAIR